MEIEKEDLQVFGGESVGKWGKSRCFCNFLKGFDGSK